MAKIDGTEEFKHIVSKIRPSDPACSWHGYPRCAPQYADRVALRDHGREKGGMDRRERRREVCEE